MSGTAAIKQHINEFWKQATEQLGEIKAIDDAMALISRSMKRIEANLGRLRCERDRLLKRVGQQAHKLIDNDRVPMPQFVRSTADKLGEALDAALKTKAKPAKKSRPRKKSAGGKRPSRRKADINAAVN